MLCPHFAGAYPTSETSGQEKKTEEIDAYEIVALALHVGLKLDDLKQMSFVSLVNVIHCYFPQKEEKELTREATQKDIDLLAR